MARDCYIGIDIGGTKLRVALINDQFEIENIAIKRDHYLLSPPRMVEMIVNIISQLTCDKEEINLLGVGIGFPGPVNKQSQKPMSYTNLFNEDWEDFNLTSMLKNKLKIPVFIDNDTNLAGMGEMEFGAGKNYENAVYLTLSTGIGGAIFINNKLYRGFLGQAGEIGHMVVNMDGRKCKCGNKGCFMGEFSGLALESFLQETPDLLNYIGSKNEPRKGVKKLFDMALDGDEKALSVVKSFSKVISTSLHNIVQILNPELFIIGGGIGNDFRALYLEEVKSYFVNCFSEEVAAGTVFKDAKLGDENGILGAALLVNNKMKKA